MGMSKLKQYMKKFLQSTLQNKIIFVVLILSAVFYVFYLNIKEPIIDLNGLWENNENTAITKITQEGNNVTFTHYKFDPTWNWPGKIGDVTVTATLSGRNLTGKIMIVPERGYCPGYTWWHDFTATISEDGKIIDEVFQTNIYDLKTCEETGEYPEKTKKLIKI